MQLYAFNPHRQLISSKQAEKQQDYFCLECQGIVRLRGGFHRQNHFYHVSPNQHCHLSGKSMEHLQVQCYLQSCLPSGDCQLECRFDQIQRIADVVCFSQKLIFEVQCSPISAQEVLERNRDYRQLGFEVVWILHEQQFNRWRVSAAEMELQGSPHYFTNMDKEGNGSIYDQYAWIDKGWRHKKLSPLPIQISGIRQVGDELSHPIFHQEKVPSKIEQRLKKGGIYFEGDLLVEWMKEFSLYREEVLLLEKQFEKVVEPVSLFKKGLRCICNAYYYVFQMLLERACR